MNLLDRLIYFLPAIRKSRKFIKSIQKGIIQYHQREIDNYISAIYYLDESPDKSKFYFYNKTIGDYLTITLHEFIRGADIVEAKDLDGLKTKRDELIQKYNNWFFRDNFF